MFENSPEISFAAEPLMPIYGSLHKVRNAFKLSYKNLEIGVLSFSNNWVFQYSNDFINQNKIKPITGFPNIHKVYQSPNLFPFFDFRIPSLKRPEIQDIIKKEQLDATNKAELLAFFGKKTITNPYVLTVIEQ
jgi:HipA-like protein